MQARSLSISFRLRRTTAEAVHVSVPITEELMRPNDEGEGMKLDVEKIVKAAIELGKSESTKWEVEGEPQIEPHPLQTPPERGSIQ
jgi:hypothetical protein